MNEACHLRFWNCGTFLHESRRRGSTRDAPEPLGTPFCIARTVNAANADKRRNARQKMMHWNAKRLVASGVLENITNLVVGWRGAHNRAIRLRPVGLKTLMLFACRSSDLILVITASHMNDAGTRLPPLNTHSLALGPAHSCKDTVRFSDATGTPTLV